MPIKKSEDQRENTLPCSVDTRCDRVAMTPGPLFGGCSPQNKHTDLPVYLTTQPVIAASSQAVDKFLK